MEFQRHIRGKESREKVEAFCFKNCMVQWGTGLQTSALYRGFWFIFPLFNVICICVCHLTAKMVTSREDMIVLVQFDVS